MKVVGQKLYCSCPARCAFSLARTLHVAASRHFQGVSCKYQKFYIFRPRAIRVACHLLAISVAHRRHAKERRRKKESIGTWPSREGAEAHVVAQEGPAEAVVEEALEEGGAAQEGEEGAAAVVVMAAQD